MRASFFAVVFLFFSAFSALAAGAPSKEILISFWEAQQKAGVETVVFEKTDAAGIYNFETTFFPYKGRLKLLNAAVSKLSGSYYSNIYNGIIEVSLLDAPKDFMEKYAMSYAAWREQSRYYYDTKKAIWFPAGDWGDYFYEEGNDGQALKTASQCQWRKAGLNAALVAGLSAFIFILIRFVRRQHKRAWEVQEKIIERQKRMLDLSEESLQVSKAILESLQKK